MTASRPTQRSLAELREREWPHQVVEYWHHYGQVRIDLFGCIDILALDGQPGSLGIQACTVGDASKRRKKALGCVNLPHWLAAGNRFEVWGWRELVASGWTLRTEPVTLEDFE
jgi:hypothetical protein